MTWLGRPQVAMHSQLPRFLVGYFGEICVVDSEVLLFKTVFRDVSVNSQFTKFGLKKLEISPYRMAKMRFDISKRLGVDN